MTVTGEAVDAAPFVRPGPLRNLRPTRATWPLWAMTAGMPFAYLLGIQGFVWCLPALVLGSRILADRNVRFPKSSIPLLVFLGWILLSTAMLESGSGYLLFLYRWSLFAGALTSLVWLVNVSEERVRSMQIYDWLAALWICMVVFGYLGVLLPEFVQKSPFQILLGPVGNIGFVDELSRWRFAETQSALTGSPLPRPAAPFNATNGWGAAIGILTPFFIRSWIVQPDLRRRRIGYAIGLAGIVPIVLSVNRGLWISLGIALVYFAARKALRGKLGPFFVLVATIVAVAGLLVVTPAGQLVQDKIDNSGKSNESRSNLYGDAYRGALKSPLIGNGAPKKAEGADSKLPPVGTHGMLWYLMFVHGFVGLALFLTWLGGEVFRSGRVRTTDGWWTHLALVIALVQVPFYGLLPQVVLFGIAAGLSHREDPS